MIRFLQYTLQNRFNPSIKTGQARQESRQLPELVIEEVEEEEEEVEETEAMEEVIQEKKVETDCYLQELEIYLESLNVKLNEVREQKDREVN